MKLRKLRLFASSLPSVRLFPFTGEKTGLMELFHQNECLLNSDSNGGHIYVEACKCLWHSEACISLIVYIGNCVYR
jgi:hypothetical protein